MVQTLYCSDTLTVEHTTATLRDLHEWEGVPPLHDVDVGNLPVHELGIITNANVQVRVNETVSAARGRNPAKVFLQRNIYPINANEDDDHLYDLCAAEVRVSAMRLAALGIEEPSLEPFILRQSDSLAQFHLNAMNSLRLAYTPQTVTDTLRAFPQAPKLMSQLALQELCETCIYDGRFLSLIKYNDLYEDQGAYGLADTTRPACGIVLNAACRAALDLLMTRSQTKFDEVTMVDTGTLLSSFIRSDALQTIDRSVNKAFEAMRDEPATGRMLLRVIDATQAQDIISISDQLSIRSQYDVLLRALDNPAERHITISEEHYDQPLSGVRYT